MKRKARRILQKHGKKVAAIGAGAVFSIGVLAGTGYQADDVLDAVGLIEGDQPSELVQENASDVRKENDTDPLEELENVNATPSPKFEQMGC